MVAGWLNAARPPRHELARDEVEMCPPSEVMGRPRAGWNAGAARCAAHFGDVAATARRAPEQGHRLSALSRTLSDWSASGIDGFAVGCEAGHGPMRSAILP
jgi:hypothetical protein